MSNSELQEEEKEVLLSIYDGDPAFNMISDTVYQYKVNQKQSNLSKWESKGLSIFNPSFPVTIPFPYGTRSQYAWDSSLFNMPIP